MIGLGGSTLMGFIKKQTDVNELTYLRYFKSVQMEGSWNIMKSKLKPINTKKI
jgi:hypothetical protein